MTPNILAPGALPLANIFTRTYRLSSLHRTNVPSIVFSVTPVCRPTWSMTPPLGHEKLTVLALVHYLIPLLAPHSLSLDKVALPRWLSLRKT